jgi:hypothetical protein
MPQNTSVNPEAAAHLARPSKDGSKAPVADPSRLGMKHADLRMTTDMRWRQCMIGSHDHH